MGPLAGIRILDLTSVLMGPYATQTLAQMGARVTKVEAPDGDIIRQIGPGRHPGMGAMFLNTNRGKRSIVLDLKQPAARDAALRLAAEADVLVYNVRPQAMARLGLSYEAAAAANPRLLYVGLFGYGQSGPNAAKPAYDDLIQGAVGIPSLVLAAGAAAPRYVPLTIADRIVGLMAVNAILGGLLHRERTGEGQRIDVPMFESMAGFVLADHQGGLTFDPPLDGGGYARLLSHHRRPFKTRDGFICALIYTDRQWRSFYEAVGRPEVVREPRYANHGERSRHVDTIYEEVGRLFLERSTAEWRAILEGADIPVTAVNTVADMLEDPHLKEVGFLEAVDHPTEGRLRQAKVAATWSRTQPEAGGPAPRLGEHGRAILSEAGFAPAEIDALAASGALRLDEECEEAQ